MLPFFAIIHPLVDACSVSVLVAGGRSRERVIAHNAMAFALQMPLGMVFAAAAGTCVMAATGKMPVVPVGAGTGWQPVLLSTKK